MLGTNLRCLDNLNGIWGFDTSNSLQTTSLVVKSHCISTHFEARHPKPEAYCLLSLAPLLSLYWVYLTCNGILKITIHLRVANDMASNYLTQTMS